MLWAGFEPAILQLLDRRPRPMIHESLLEMMYHFTGVVQIFHNYVRAQFNLWAQCVRLCIDSENLFFYKKIA